MLTDRWNATRGGNSISQKVMDKVKPDEPLKNKIDYAQKKLDFQINKLGTITEKLQKKHDLIFRKIVQAQKVQNHTYAKAYAAELHEIRKMKNMIGGAKLSMEQIQIRLNTVSELGDVVVTLSPAMSVIKGLSASIGGIMPEANATMQDLTQILGDVMSGSSVSSTDVMSTNDSVSVDTQAILEEAHALIEGETRANIPDVPSGLKEDIAERRRTLI